MEMCGYKTQTPAQGIPQGRRIMASTKLAHAYDHVTLRNVGLGVFWDQAQHQPYPQPIDTWVLTHHYL